MCQPGLAHEHVRARGPSARVLLRPVPARVAGNHRLDGRDADHLPARLRVRPRHASSTGARTFPRASPTSTSWRRASSPRRPCRSRPSSRAGRCCPRSSGAGSTTRCSRRRSGSRDIVLGHQAFIAFRMFITATVYLIVIAAFGAVAVAARDPRDPGDRARRARVLALRSQPGRAYTETDASFVAIFRFVILPMFLFSGAFFPIEQLPGVLQVVAYATAALARRRALPAAHARRRRAERARAPRVPPRVRRRRASPPRSGRIGGGSLV